MGRGWEGEALGFGHCSEKLLKVSLGLSVSVPQCLLQLPAPNRLEVMCERVMGGMNE